MQEIISSHPYWQKLDYSRHGTYHSFKKPDFQSRVLSKLRAYIPFTQSSIKDLTRLEYSYLNWNNIVKVSSASILGMGVLVLEVRLYLSSWGVPIWRIPPRQVPPIKSICSSVWNPGPICTHAPNPDIPRGHHSYKRPCYMHANDHLATL